MQKLSPGLKATCKDCGDFYIGNTQQHLKKRMNQHFIEVRSLVNRDLTSDSFAKHFASHFQKNEKIATKDVRAKVTMGILWKGNPISCSKSFGKLNCSLCMKERLLILKALGDKKEKRLINSNNELYGACRHKSKFHRYTNTTNSNTDDGINPERGIEISVGSPSLSSQDSDNNTGTRMCIFIDTNISNNLDVPFENHDAISPLSCDENVVGDPIENFVMDV